MACMYRRYRRLNIKSAVFTCIVKAILLLTSKEHILVGIIYMSLVKDSFQYNDVQQNYHETKPLYLCQVG